MNTPSPLDRWASERCLSCGGFRAVYYSPEPHEPLCDRCLNWALFALAALLSLKLYGTARYDVARADAEGFLYEGAAA